jgi:hypothetical protein
MEMRFPRFMQELGPFKEVPRFDTLIILIVYGIDFM